MSHGQSGGRMTKKKQLHQLLLELVGFYDRSGWEIETLTPKLRETVMKMWERALRLALQGNHDLNQEFELAKVDYEAGAHRKVNSKPPRQGKSPVCTSEE